MTTPRSSRTTCSALALAALLLACGRSDAPRPIDAGRMGRASVFAPRGGHAGFVYLFSDAAGWSPALDAEVTRAGGSRCAACLPPVA